MREREVPPPGAPTNGRIHVVRRRRVKPTRIRPITPRRNQAGHALELLHLLRQGGLRHMPAGGGAREMLFGDADERREVQEVYVIMSDMSAQQWNAADYAAHARFVSDLGQPVLDLLQPQAGERILDLGCGDGALTEQLSARGSIVVGIDTSADLLAAARGRGLDVRLVDAQALSFVDEFDAVFSNAVLHWIPDLTPVLNGVYRALRSHGRFVGEFGGHGCVAAVCTALRAVAARRDVELTLPWNFATVEDVEACLAATGFEALFVRLVPRPTSLPSGMPAWLRTFAGWVFDALPEADREAAYAETVELLRPALCDSRGRWTADYVRLRFAARRVEIA